MIWCIKTYIIAQNAKKIRFIIHYVKPTAQLLFKIRFPKGGPTCRIYIFYMRFIDIIIYEIYTPAQSCHRYFLTNVQVQLNSTMFRHVYMETITIISMA